MCGIAGFQGSFEPQSLRRMAAAMAHRGPDDEGVWLCEASSTGLAHRRLSIIDTSALGHQPMVGASGSAGIVFNGEIYNFRELREALVCDGHRFRTQSDTEVLLTLYESVGEGILDRLNG